MDAKPIIVKVLKPFSMYWPGMIAGFDPDQAERLIAKGFAVEVDVDQSGNQVVDQTIEPTALVEDQKPVATHDPSAVEIPDDWATSHHLVQIRIAKLIAGAEKMTAADAKQVIAAEIERRAGLAPVEN